MAADNGDQADRQTAVDAVATNDARLQALIGSIDEVVFEFDAKGIVLNVWTRDASLLARPQSEIIGRRGVDALSQESAAAFEAAFQRVLITGHSENLEYPLDVIGGRKWFLARINAIPAPPGSPQTVCMLVRDITEHKREEAALRESEERLRLTTSNSNTGLWDWDLRTNRFYFSPIWKRQIGYEDHEISDSYHEWESRVHPDDLDRALAAVKNCLENRRPDYESEFRFRHKNGSDRWILAKGTLLLDEQGQLRRLLGAHIDVTERKLAEEKLKQTAERLSTLLSTSQALSSTLNLDALLEQLLHRVAEAIPAVDFGAIYIYDTQAEVLIPKVAVGGNREALWQVRLKVGESISGRVLQSGQSVLTRTAEENERSRGPESPETERLFAQARFGRSIQSNICVPLRSSTGEVIGTVALGSIHESFNEDDLSLLEGIASQAAIAIQNAKLFDEVRTGRERLRVLSSQLISTQETERCHLARELHDEIGQVLTTIKMHLRSTQRSVDLPVQSYLEESIAMVDRAIGQVRNLSLNLRPAQLDELGLVAALHWYVKQQAQIAGFQEHFVVDPLEMQVPSELATACFRITQEAMTNAVRHGQPRHIHVELRHCGERLNLTVRDDGVGFDVQEARQRTTQGKSLGLLGMQERAQLSDGHLEIESRIGYGTAIRVEFPMPR